MLKIQGTELGLHTDGAEQLLTLGTNCDGMDSKWDVICATNMLFSSLSSRSIFLDTGPNGRDFVTNPCRCLQVKEQCDPESQWFKLVRSTRKLTSEQSNLEK